MTNAIERSYLAYLDERRQKNRLRRLITTTAHSARELTVNGRPYINFSSNDYLGLSQRTELKQNAINWLNKYGTGTSSSRLITGNHILYHKLEKQLASLKQKQEALIFSSGFQANSTILEALFDTRILGHPPLVLFDKANHASMYMGCFAAGISPHRYRHNDIEHLTQLLERHKKKNPKAPVFIVSETVFSMNGDKAHLSELARLAKLYDGFLIADDAHGFGVFGDQGAGLGHEADMVIGTFGKALGSFGAFVACSTTIYNLLINRCQGLIYSTALPPATLGAIEAGLKLLPNFNKQRQFLLSLSDYFKKQIQIQGFNIGHSQTHIVPLIVGDEQQTIELSLYLKGHNIWATPIRPPTVQQGQSRLRLAFNAVHTNEDIEQLLRALFLWRKK